MIIKGVLAFRCKIKERKEKDQKYGEERERTPAACQPLKH